MKLARQGDVLIKATNKPEVELTKAQKIDGRWILAEGEATGHAHAIKAAKGVVLWMTAAAMYLEARRQVKIEHEEHAPIMLPPGWYEIRRQREYEPDGWRQVAD